MPPLSNEATPVTPSLAAALVCDSAVQDPTSGKWSLIGVFSHINAATFPTVRPLSVYFRIGDAEGEYSLLIEHVHVATEAVLARAEGAMTIKDRTAYLDVAIALPPLQFREPGLYEIRIWANRAYLGCARIIAKKIDPA